MDGWDDDANHCFKEGQLCSIGMTLLYTQLDMLWCNFVLGAIFFPLFKTHYHTLSYITIPPKQREKNCTTTDILRELDANTFECKDLDVEEAYPSSAAKLVDLRSRSGQ